MFETVSITERVCAANDDDDDDDDDDAVVADGSEFRTVNTEDVRVNTNGALPSDNIVTVRPPVVDLPMMLLCQHMMMKLLCPTAMLIQDDAFANEVG